MKFIKAAKKVLFLCLLLAAFSFIHQSNAQLCETPHELLVENPTMSGFDVSWESVPGVSGYDFKVKVNGLQVYQTTLITTSISYTYSFAVQHGDQIQVEVQSICGPTLSPPNTWKWIIDDTIIASVEVVYATDPEPCITDCPRATPDALRIDEAYANALVDEYGDQYLSGGTPSNFDYEKESFCTCSDGYLNSNPGTELGEAMYYCIMTEDALQITNRQTDCDPGGAGGKQASLVSELLNNIQNDLLLEVYPNPFHESPLIKITAKRFNTVEMKIFNQLGITSINKTFLNETGGGSFEYRFETSHLSPGFYIIQIVQGENTITRKILKN